MWLHFQCILDVIQIMKYMGWTNDKLGKNGLSNCKVELTLHVSVYFAFLTNLSVFFFNLPTNRLQRERAERERQVHQRRAEYHPSSPFHGAAAGTSDPRWTESSGGSRPSGGNGIKWPKGRARTRATRVRLSKSLFCLRKFVNNLLYRLRNAARNVRFHWNLYLKC